MHKLAPFLTVLFLSLNFSFSQVKQQLNHDGYKRTWLTYLPKTYSKEKQYPLVIALHGGGGSANQLMQNTKKHFNQLADNESFIVVYPQGIKKSWNDNSKRDINGYARKHNIDDVGFIKKMLHQLESKYSVNPNAIFACGISNGGLMSQTLAMELPNTIKAIAMVASNFGKLQIEKTKTVSPFSVLFIHGIDDPLFPYKEGEIGVFNKSRGQVLGIEKSIAYMCNLNGNSKTNPTTTPIKNTALYDDCTSEHVFYPNKSNPKLKVELIRIEGGGHTWPGAKKQRLISRLVGRTTQDFNACDKIWGFFKSLIH